MWPIWRNSDCLWASWVAQTVKNRLQWGRPGFSPRGSPGGGHGNSPQYSCLENPYGHRSLADYSPWVCKELDMIEWLSTHTRLTLWTNAHEALLGEPAWFPAHGVGGEITSWEAEEAGYSGVLKEGFTQLYRYCRQLLVSIFFFFFPLFKKKYVFYLFLFSWARS